MRDTPDGHESTVRRNGAGNFRSRGGRCHFRPPWEGYGGKTTRRAYPFASPLPAPLVQSFKAQVRRSSPLRNHRPRCCVGGMASCSPTPRMLSPRSWLCCTRRGRAPHNPCMASGGANQVLCTASHLHTFCCWSPTRMSPPLFFSCTKEGGIKNVDTLRAHFPHECPTFYSHPYLDWPHQSARKGHEACTSPGSQSSERSGSAVLAVPCHPNFLLRVSSFDDRNPFVGLAG